MKKINGIDVQKKDPTRCPHCLKKECFTLNNTYAMGPPFGRYFQRNWLCTCGFKWRTVVDITTEKAGK